MDSIIERIEIIIRSKNLSPSKLADEIGVQRSGISHIMSGRNKPSLDFILKVLDAYPEINADWLLKGEGEMAESPGLIDFEANDEPETERKGPSKISMLKNNSGKKAVKVIIFYDDQSFDEIVDDPRSAPA
jgi:transcriptional regulator with XRE-family HTH domain